MWSPRRWSTRRWPGRRRHGRGRPRPPTSAPRPVRAWSPPGRPHSRPSGPTTGTRSTIKRREPPANGWPTTGWRSPPSSRRSAGATPSSTNGSPATRPGRSSSASSCPVLEAARTEAAGRWLPPHREERKRIDERIAEAGFAPERMGGPLGRPGGTTPGAGRAAGGSRTSPHRTLRRASAGGRAPEAARSRRHRRRAIAGRGGRSAQSQLGLGPGRAAGAALPAPARGRPGRRGPARGAPPSALGQRARAGRHPRPPPEGRTGPGGGHHPARVGDRGLAPRAGLRARRGPVGPGSPSSPRAPDPADPDRPSWRPSWPPSAR